MKDIEGYLEKLEEKILKHRRTIVWIGISLIILMLLIPPWIKIYPHPKGGTIYGERIGYYLIFAPPTFSWPWSANIDFISLIFQIAPIIILVVLVFYLSRNLPIDQNISLKSNAIKGWSIIYSCPNCGTNNKISDPFKEGRRYKCGKCNTYFDNSNFWNGSED